MVLFNVSTGSALWAHAVRPKVPESGRRLVPGAPLNSLIASQFTSGRERPRLSRYRCADLRVFLMKSRWANMDGGSKVSVRKNNAPSRFSRVALTVIILEIP